MFGGNRAESFLAEHQGDLCPGSIFIKISNERRYRFPPPFVNVFGRLAAYQSEEDEQGNNRANDGWNNMKSIRSTNNEYPEQIHGLFSFLRVYCKLCRVRWNIPHLAVGGGI